MPNRRQLVERKATWRCEYCRAPQQICGYRFHIEHIVPLAIGGSEEHSNLALACGPCNLAKATRTQFMDPLTGTLVPLFHPCRDSWSDHFDWAQDGGTLVGRTPTGRATILALDMNASLRLEARGYWRALNLLP